MKRMLLVFALAVCLLTAAPHVYAFAIYNHIDEVVCVSHYAVPTISDPVIFPPLCIFKVHPNSTYNGEHGAGLKDVYFLWKGKKGGDCVGHATNVAADIPKGGFARIYKGHVDVYRHCSKCSDDDRLAGHPFHKTTCLYIYSLLPKRSEGQVYFLDIPNLLY